MEKNGKPQPGKWLFNDEDMAPNNVLWETLCCPCIVYGRSKERLEEAFERRSYSCLICGLRGSVRDLYNIGGSAGRDWFWSCFYPCDTLIQVENEIIERETCRKPSVCVSGYESQPPMTTSSSSSSRSHSKVTTPDTEPDESLPCIPEDSSEATSTTQSSASSRQSSKKRERSIARDPVAPTDATLDHSHDLAKDPKGPAYKASGKHKLKDDTSTPTYPPSIHQLRADTKAPASPPAVHRHDLFHDASEAYPAQSSNHDIGFDQVETFRASPQHQLRQDEKTPGAYPSSHNLHNDMTKKLRSGQVAGHTNFMRKLERKGREQGEAGWVNQYY
ncbi:hypothetical protein F53441_10121 [Fusarium austroafricanum]|uniref:Uncharacterized protein n=1 Tax=Fusarium austroafricanum TaxID=2364996 RepID=A0A8H4NVR4_9HYPO|nr:hypothetical protein F53441_10121 [Fusarium austroafricanum]